MLRFTALSLKRRLPARARRTGLMLLALKRFIANPADGSPCVDNSGRFSAPLGSAAKIYWSAVDSGRSTLRRKTSFSRLMHTAKLALS